MLNFLIIDEMIKEPELLDIFISNLFRYVIYFYPGIITVYLTAFFRGLSEEKNKALIIKAISYSYVYNLALSKFISFYDNVYKYNLLLLIISVAVSFALQKLLRARFLVKLCDMLGIDTLLKDCDIDILKDDDEAHTYIRIYLKNKPIVYSGFLLTHEREYNRNRYIIICGYMVHSICHDYTETIIKKFKPEDCNEKVLIYLEQVERIEKCSLDRIKCDNYCDKQS